MCHMSSKLFNITTIATLVSSQFKDQESLSQFHM
jgi:hypothetical protein